jgi:microcystin degradation protein MlrC
LAERFWQARQSFAVKAISVAEAVRRGREIAGGPVLLLDTADTTGGGATGDGIGLVRGLLEAGVTEPSLATVVDQEAAAMCHAHGIGREVSVKLGHKLDPTWGKSIPLAGTVTQLSEGTFHYTGGILGGSWASMGLSAVLRIGSIQVLIASTPTYEWADEQYRAMGLSPTDAKFVGVKNMMNFRFGYREVMKGFFVLDLPGPTPADLRQLSFRRIRRPMFPLDEECTPDIRLCSSEPIEAAGANLQTRAETRKVEGRHAD